MLTLRDLTRRPLMMNAEDASCSKFVRKYGAARWLVPKLSRFADSRNDVKAKVERGRVSLVGGGGGVRVRTLTRMLDGGPG